MRLRLMLLTCIALYFPAALYGQKCPVWKQQQGTCDPVHERSTGLQAYIGGPTGLGAIDLSGFFAPAFSIHGGIGITGCDIGVAWHLPLSSRHVSLYGGTDLAYTSGDVGLDLNQMRRVIFFPLGCRYIFCNGISLGAELMPGADKNETYLWGSLKIGYFFRRNNF